MNNLLTAVLFGVSFLPQGDAVIRVSIENGDAYCDVRAEDYPVHRLMSQLCAKLGDRELRGFEDVDSSPLVSVALRHRPLAQTVDYILGAAGMSGTVTARRIEVRGELPPFPEPRDARDAARIAYLSALRFFPESDQAPLARMELAQIALEQGHPQRAVDHYTLLLEEHSDVEVAVEARMRAGRLLVELEDWSRAVPMFETVANFKIDESTAELLPIIAEARRELARCVLHRGEPRRTLFMLLGLENAIPSENNAERATRLYLLAHAELELGDHVECLRYLDQAQRIGRGAIDEFEGMDLRARAMELAGRQIEAALGWLHFSREKSPDIQRKALTRAAELALSVEGEELAVLFLHRLAEEDGIGEALLPAANEARARLGMDAESYLGGTPSMRLRRAELLLSSGLAAEASDVLAGLESDAWALSAKDRLSYALVYAPILESEKSVEAAIGLLRDVARTLESTENRSGIYLLAGEIYQRHGRFEEEAAAYGGEL